MGPPFLHFLAPLFLVFEAWQLVIAERYLGVKQIDRGLDPRDGDKPGELLSFVWSGGIILYWWWMIFCLYPKEGRVQIACMLVVTLLGFSLRRNSPLKWILVILTLEGAIRIGMLISLIAAAWRAL